MILMMKKDRCWDSWIFLFLLKILTGTYPIFPRALGHIPCRSGGLTNGKLSLFHRWRNTNWKDSEWHLKRVYLKKATEFVIPANLFHFSVVFMQSHSLVHIRRIIALGSDDFHSPPSASACLLHSRSFFFSLPQ